MDDDQIDGGLAHDLPRVTRRSALGGLLGGAGIALLAACSSETPTATGPRLYGIVGAGEIPEETEGPFPADGSNSLNVLAESGILRSDIRASFGSATGVATGIPLTLKLKVVDLSEDSKPLEGAAVYVWHCDREGNYSLYSPGFTEENYLRGVQPADRDGVVTFQSIYPAAYPGRWPHIHFEVYESVAKATGILNKMRTSQLALPGDVNSKVYSTAGYEPSAGNLAQTSLDSDAVFADGFSLQLATMTGSNDEGWTATLTVPV